MTKRLICGFRFALVAVVNPERDANGSVREFNPRDGNGRPLSDAPFCRFALPNRRGETLQPLHVWWARRPHSAMRALLFGALSLDRSPDAIDLMCDLSRHPIPPPLLDTTPEATAERRRRRSATC
jgi:hypothetical protein